MTVRDYVGFILIFSFFGVCVGGGGGGGEPGLTLKSLGLVHSKSMCLM